MERLLRNLNLLSVCLCFCLWLPLSGNARDCAEGESFRTALQGSLDQGDLSRARTLLTSRAACSAQAGAEDPWLHYGQGLLSAREGRQERAVEHFRKASQSAGDKSNLRLKGLAELKAGITMGRLRADSLALLHLNEAEFLLEKAAYLPGLVSSLHQKAILAYRRQEDAQGDSLLWRAFQLAQDEEDMAMLGTLLNQKGIQLYQRSAYGTSVWFLLESLEMYRAAGKRADQARTLSILGAVLYQTGDLQGARGRFEASLNLGRELKQGALVADALTNLASVHRDLGELDRALEVSFEAIEMNRSLGRIHGKSSTLTNISVLYEEKESLDLAVYYQEKALILDREAGDKAGEAIGRVNLGRYFRKLGHPQTALRHFREAEPLVEELMLEELKSDLYEGLSACLESEGKSVASLGYLRKAMAFSEGEEKTNPEQTPVQLQVLQFENKQLVQAQEALRVQLNQRDRGLWGMGLLLGLSLLAGVYQWRVGRKLRHQQKEFTQVLEKQSREVASLERRTRELENELEMKTLLLARLQEQPVASGTKGSGSKTLVQKLHLNSDWANFFVEFECVFPGYLHHLQHAHPDLSPADLRTLSLLRLNLSSAEMADLLHITVAGVNKARQRVRKKLGLPAGASLRKFLNRF